MAGDWLKLEAATPEKAEVLAITTAMGWDDPDLTVGKLFRVWRWFDQQTTDGCAKGVTAALLDRIVGVTGFAVAMESVEWLVSANGGVELPNFDRHNGATAKARAMTARRVKRHSTKGNSKRPRNAKANAAPNGNTNGALTQGPLPREEKRREEKKQELTSLPATPLISELPKDGVAAMEIVRMVVNVVAPRVRWDDFTVSAWMRDINPDPYWIAAALCEAEKSIGVARECSYLTAVLRRKAEEGFPEGWTSEDSREYANHALQSIVRQRGAA